MKKKILFITMALWVGGIESALINLLKQLDYDKYDITLLVLKAELNLLPQIPPHCRVLIADRDKQVSFDEPYRDSRLYHLVEAPSLPSRRHRLLQWTVPILRWIENRRYIRYIRACMQNDSFDTAVIYSDVAGEIAVKAVKAKKYILFYHHGIMRHAYHDRVAWRRSEKVVAVSEHQAEKLRVFMPRFADKITVIHNLAALDFVQKQAEEPLPQQFDPDCFHIVTVGRVSKEKGMDLAVSACGILKRDGYTNVRWWIVGGGPALLQLQEQVKASGLEQFVYTVGMVQNPYPYIKAANLYVQPSRFEGYPMTLLEALSLGKPVVSTDNDGAKEILNAFHTGLLCPISAEELAAQIEMLLEEPRVLERLQCGARAVNLDSENRRILDLLHALL